MNRLKEVRNEYGLTIRALEKIIGISNTSISYYELESRDFNTTALKTIANFFCVSIDYLLCNSDEGVFVYYEQGEKVYRLDDSSFKKYKADNLIYYKDYKRYLDINSLLGIKKETNITGLLDIINEKDMIENSLKLIKTSKVDVPVEKVELIEKIIKLDDSKFNAVRSMVEFL